MRPMLLVSAAALALTACGGSGGNTDSSAPDTEAPAPSSVSAEAPVPAPDGSAGPADDNSGSDRETALAALPSPYSEADLANGRRQFRRCSSCHTLEAGGPNRVGPNLHGIFARQAGEAEGFNYSPALRESGIDWTPEHLDSWLADPRGYIPGNRMSFAGLREEADRRDLIAYLLIETSGG